MPGETLLVFQSGGPTGVINATLAGVIEQARSSGYTRVLGAQHGITGLVTETLVDLSALSLTQLDRLARTPGAALGTSRQRLDESSSRAALATLRAHRVTAVVAIGGNDTAASALVLLAAAEQAGYPLAVVLAPKTIDNDLSETDHTPGYPSAAHFLALATRDLMLDCRSLATFYAFTVLEVQGRNAGWLVAACGLAIDESLATHLQLVFPERPPRSSHDLAEEFASLQQRLGWLLLVVPETLRREDGRPLAEAAPRWVDPHGHPYPPSPAEALAHALETVCGARARVIRPGALARCFRETVVELDREEARAIGRTAVEWLATGQSAVMVGIERLSDDPYRVRFRPVPLQRVADHERLLPPEFISQDGRRATTAFARYARPLVGEFAATETHLAWSR